MARKIEFFEFGEGDTMVDTKTIYIDRLKVNREGMALDEMEERLAIMSKLANSDDTVILEDAEWRRLRDVMKAEKWAVASEDIVNLMKAVTEAETVKIEEVA